MKALGIILMILAFSPPQVYAKDGRKPVAKESGDAGTAAGKIFKDCADCPEMVVIPAGSFDMGSNNDPSEKPVHRVTIGRAFAMGKTEVTQGQWKALMGNNPSKYSDCGDNCPVEQVSWDDARAFIEKLNAKTGKQYRLPTEAEWEYACRAGGQHEYCGGDNPDSVGWYGALAKPAAIAAKRPARWQPGRPTPLACTT